MIYPYLLPQFAQAKVAFDQAKADSPGSTILLITSLGSLQVTHLSPGELNPQQKMVIQKT